MFHDFTMDSSTLGTPPSTPKGEPQFKKKYAAETFSFSQLSFSSSEVSLKCPWPLGTAWLLKGPVYLNSLHWLQWYSRATASLHQLRPCQQGTSYQGAAAS